MKLKHELNSVSMVILIILSISIVSVGIIMMTGTVYDLNKRLLQLEIANIVRKVNSVFNILYETGLSNVDKYVQSAQSEVVNEFTDYSFGDSGNLFVLDNNQNVIYHKDIPAGTYFDYDFAKELIKNQQGFLEYTYDGKPRFGVFATFEPWRWTISLSITKKEMFAYTELFVRYVTIVTVSILFLSIITILIISHRITTSIYKTLNCLQEVEKGNLSSRIIPDTSTEEIIILQQGINSMIHTIQKRTEELLKSKEARMQIEKRLLQEEIQHKEAEINVLQSQINPHFLYNTLECINSFGAVYESEEIQEVAMSLSNIFKYAIRGGKFVTVAEEVRSVKHYLKIQRIRFTDKISVELDFHDDLLDSRMLKFLLQPIIENSIFHGLEPKMGKGHLLVSGKLNDSLIEFKIQDDGVGMGAENLSYLRSGLEDLSLKIDSQDAKKRSIGLFNIQNRIRLVYGDQYGLRIDSQIQEGTTVRLILPVL